MIKKISGLILREDLELFKKEKGILTKGYLRQQKTIERAEEILKLFANGEVEVNPRDYPDFAQYIDAFANEEDKEKLFDHMLKVQGFNAADSIKKQKANNRKHDKKIYIQIVKLPQLKGQIKKSFARTASFIKKAWKCSKVALITAAVIIGGAFGIKTDSESHPLTPKNAINIKKLPYKRVENKKMASFKETQDTIQTSKYKNIYKNFYDTKLEILTSATQRDAMYAQIETQINNGIFTLPADMGKEQVAYIDAMYKAYGLESPIENALSGKHKLSTEQQAQLIKDLSVKDYEIKNKALVVHGKLNSNSTFEKADRNLQKRHITNLKQLRSLKQKSAVK